MAPQPDAGLRECAPALQRWKASPVSGSETARTRMRRRYLWSGYRPEPLPSHREPVEQPSSGRVGVCCSGGGIRSAAFNLGALQELQQAKVLQRAKYLAAVSGGSYIAAAFATVRKASRDGVDDDSDAHLIASQLPFAPGSPEEQYLRNRCDYLAPDGMAKLYLGWRVVLGLLFNVVFLALPLIGATIVLGASFYQRQFPSLVTPPAGAKTACTTAATATAPAKFHCDTIPLPSWAWLAPLVLIALSIATGLVLMLFRSRNDSRRRALETWTTRLFVGAALLALLTVALPELVALLHPGQGSSASASKHTSSTVAKVTGSGLVALLVALSAQLRAALNTVEKDVKAVEGAASKFKALAPKLQRAFAYAVAAIVGPLLFYAVIVFTMSLTLANAGTVVHRERLLTAGVGTLALSCLIYLRIDITALSLHHFYKRRLCTAFSLRRVFARPVEDGSSAMTSADDARPRPATDPQEESSGIAIERDYDRLTPLSATKVTDGKWPTLLVCAAANISDPGATPPGRHVTSFTFSPHSVGGPLVGAMATDEYERAFDENHSRARDLTLPAAVAMSGAAIAPSMGKLTRRPLTFLLALGNVRLGVWVPNPRWVASRGLWKRPGERWRPPRASYLIRELVGRNRVDGRYLFVTDGGHYENLGLVELLRRGCTEIYCFDASGGESFSELGDAVAIARSELGVDIRIDPSPLTPSSKDSSAKTDGPATEAPQASNASAAAADPNVPAKRPLRAVLVHTAACVRDACRARSGAAPDESGAKGAAPTSVGAIPDSPSEPGMAADNVVRGSFRYRDGTEGVLYYARNVMTSRAPWDVRARHIEDPTFPHDPTTDQLYTDQKFESYRALGAQAGTRALRLAGVL